MNTQLTSDQIVFVKTVFEFDIEDSPPLSTPLLSERPQLYTDMMTLNKPKKIATGTPFEFGEHRFHFGEENRRISRFYLTSQ